MKIGTSPYVDCDRHQPQLVFILKPIYRDMDTFDEDWNEFMGRLGYTLAIPCIYN